MKNNSNVGVFVIIASLIFLFFSAKYILVDSFIEIEERRARRSIEIFLNALENELTEIDMTAVDWAAWDDTCRFVETADKGYVRDNLTDLTFIKQRLSMMVFTDNSGRIVFEKAFDLNARREVPLPDNLREYLLPDSVLLSHPGVDSGHRGILLLPEGPLLVASRPVLTSKYEGPSRGTLIMGRYLDQDEINRVAKMTLLSVAVTRLDAAEIPGDFRSALSSMSMEKNIYIHSLGENVMAGYALLGDLNGKPCLAVRVDVPREIYSRGKTGMVFFVLIFIFLVYLIFMENLLDKENRERIKAEKKLRENEEKFYLMADNAPIMLWMSESGEDRSFFNKGWLDFTGRTMEQEKGAGWAEGVHPEDRDNYFKTFSSAFAARSDFSMVYRLRRADGEYRWILDRGVPQSDKDGAFCGYIGSCIDITERKKAEEAIREGEERFRSAFQYAAIGMALVATDGTWFQVNRSLCEMIGYQEHELLKKHFQEITHPDDLKKDFECIRRLLAGVCRFCHYEKRYYHKQGHIIWVEISVSVLRDERGKPLYFLPQIQDITRRKQAEEDLMEARIKADRAERMASLGAMAAGIAHEINQPLNSLKLIVDGCLYWYEKGKIYDSKEIIEKFTDIACQANRIDKIVKRMRSLVRKNMISDLGSSSLNPTVEGVLNMLGSQLNSSGIRVKTTLESILPGVRGERYRLEEVVINLVVNAMQALNTLPGKDREIHIATFQDQNVVLEISDNATGISEEHGERVFHPFFTTKEAGDGMGLGLSIAHSIVTSLGGQISFRNNEQGGATFRVELPVSND